MDESQAQRVIESLRKGIPPDGFVRRFTVGRESEIQQLTGLLENPDTTAVLLQANYGSGKTHLLRYIREHALAQGYAVSSVTLDAKSAVRFNRMDQILGAVCRGVEIQSTQSAKGIRSFFSILVGRANCSEGEEFWDILSHGGKWDYSDVLNSPALFLALRAWFCGQPNIQDTVEDWLLQPWNYRTQRKRLYLSLVENLRAHFRDPRPEWKFHADEIFVFHTQAYAQSWGALRDLNRLACAAGLKGLIILFDEFEDVLTNLTNSQHQDEAFWNLFRFFQGKEFTGMTFYAVTPEFAEKATLRLRRRGNWNYGAFAGTCRVEDLPTFQMSPLTTSELEALAMKILNTHSIAYGWEADLKMKAADLRSIVRTAAAHEIQDRARYAIVSVVRALDDLLEDTQ